MKKMKIAGKIINFPIKKMGKRGNKNNLIQ
jgi:hypothetical protein